MEQNISVQNSSSKEEKPTVITIILPTNAYFISGIRDFTLGLIRNMTEFSEQWAFRFQSVVDELCNNAIEHGSRPGENIKLTFINHPHNSIEIIVEDSGTGKSSLKADDIARIVTERSHPNYVHNGIRGRGLSKIVAEWTDELEFTNIEGSGVRVRVKKFLKDLQVEQDMARVMDSPTHLVLN
jgi:anti-sigma regulatory factor (Ser/Thr protein kinase)